MILVLTVYRLLVAQWSKDMIPASKKAFLNSGFDRLLMTAIGLVVAISASGYAMAQDATAQASPELVSILREKFDSRLRVSFEFERFGERRDEKSEAMLRHGIEYGKFFRDEHSYRMRHCSLSMVPESTRLRHQVCETVKTALDTDVGRIASCAYRELERGDIELSHEVWELPAFRSMLDFPGEVTTNFAVDAGIDSLMPFWTGEVGGIGNVADAIANSTSFARIDSNFMQMESCEISGGFKGREFHLTFLPDLDWMIARIEIFKKGSGDQPDSHIVMTVSDMSEDRTALTFVLESSKDVAGTRILNYRTITKFRSIKKGSAAEVGWAPYEVPNESPVRYLGNPQIELIWRNGRLEKSVDELSVRNLHLPLEFGRLETDRPIPDPARSAFIFVFLAVAILYRIDKIK
jgi:hypothetical protein